MEETLDPVIIESIRNDLQTVGGRMQELARRIIEEGVSEYPIFIASDEMIPLGKLLFDREEFDLNWFFQVSVLEDFVRKGLITREKLTSFRRAYDEPAQTACILVVREGDAHFVFVPYREPEDSVS